MQVSSSKPAFAGSKVHLRGDLVDEEVARLSIGSAPLLYGLAVYTVISVRYNPKDKTYLTFRVQDHVRRLNNSAKIVGMQPDEPITKESFNTSLAELMRANQVRKDCLVRCTLFTDEVLAGTKSHGLPTGFSMYAYGGEPMYDPQGVNVCVSAWRRTPDSAIPARAKINGSYINATLMKNQALADGYDDAIALTIDGHVAESTVANVFLVRDGKLITPDISADILEGITRDTIIRLAKSSGLEVVERRIDRSELYIADEIFLTGTSAAVTPVLSVDKRPVAHGKPGLLTKRLQRDHQRILSGELVLDCEWITVL